MSSLVAKIVMMLGAIWMVVAVVLPLVPELIILLRTKEEKHVLKSKSLFLHMAMMVAAGLGILFVFYSLKFGSYGHFNAEAKTNLGALYTAQVAYFGEHNTYAGRRGVNGSGCFDDLKWRPEGETRYTYYCGGDKLLPTQRRVVSPYDPQGNWPIDVKPQSSSHSFTIMAVTSVDADPPLDVWTTGDSKELRNLINGADKIKGPGPVEIWIIHCTVILMDLDVFSLIFFSPFLIVMVLTPFLWASLRNDWRHYKRVRERASAVSLEKQDRDVGE
jgi:hypothetical protein